MLPKKLSGELRNDMKEKISVDCPFCDSGKVIATVNGTPIVTGFKAVGDGVKAINAMCGKADKS